MVKKKINYEGSIAVNFPEMAKQFHTTKNVGFAADTLSPYCKDKVWWKCELGHEWEIAPAFRIREDKISSCPYCGNRKLSDSNSLKILYPKFAAEFDVEKNGTTPDKVLGNTGRYWWQCLIEPSHIWKVNLVDRITYNTGCPFCSNKKVCATNNLAECFPEIAKEFDIEKNGIEPTKVPYGSHKDYWWICSKNPIHQWSTRPQARTAQKQGCPYCAQVKTSIENSVYVLHPEMINLVDDDTDLTKIGQGCHSKINWKFPCGHKRFCTTGKLLRSQLKCSRCGGSIGEKCVEDALNYLLPKEAVWDDHVEIPCSVKKRGKSYMDFIIEIAGQKSIYIEYDGLQHYEPFSFGKETDFEKMLEQQARAEEKFIQQQLRDAESHAYCRAHGHLIIIDCREISYDQIESYLRQEIKKIYPDLYLTPPKVPEFFLAKNYDNSLIGDAINMIYELKQEQQEEARLIKQDRYNRDFSGILEDTGILLTNDINFTQVY